ncbi:MAG: hypothetical protein JWO90_2496, partial [Solirubrobacterales bacterium]|nr:hypothetical protein [Solirubrobacterales bacterium]
MGDTTSSRVTGAAGAVAALAVVGALFAGAGVVGGGVGSFDLWPDWSGTPRPSVEAAASSPNGPGTNPLLPRSTFADGSRPLGGDTASFVTSATAFSAGPGVATAGILAAVSVAPAPA